MDLIGFYYKNLTTYSAYGMVDKLSIVQNLRLSFRSRKSVV